MALQLSSLNTIPVSYATCSIGCKAEHTLPKRLEAIANAGFTAVELSMPDILEFASMHLRKEVGPYDYDDLVTASKLIKGMCDAKDLKVLMLQPFSNFEGWAEGSPEREDAFRRARGWIRIMEAAGTDMLQVGSSDTPSPKIGTDRNRFVSDLQELATLLDEKSFRICYENWCWSSHAPDWKDVWDIVGKVDRSNVGLCLDTFQTAGGEWADPTTESGLIESLSKDELRQKFQNSLELLSKTVPADKIYLLQISDAYRPKQRINNKEDGSGLRPRGQWSHDFRPLPFNGGYLPVVEVTKAVLKTGFRGWFSFEVFDGGPDGKGKDYELQDYADAAMEAQKRLIQECAETK
ncbi:3-dehydroshikimate dehydratase [Venturia nashicola]|uniref:3-dehydroshikimate dehydratase n=1 Tax=Venturia nashicola TaxID=86259 RepID=A0A4Z1PEL8_9PEZI|nr:3-dehydroshikimate dehydratase [Venturia nashicola]